ncbi:hypothetical protein Tco_1153735, partial [Tanacetum coccineum]
TMADVDVNAPAEQAPAMAPPTRTDDQILPRIRWVPIGKSNCYLDVERSQSNPIYKIAVDILKHTNFFRAFTASSTIPSIYIQQFWDTVRYDNKTGSYSCQLDEQWFDLTTDINRYLKGKTSGFERPRALVLQILWGIVNRAHIDYAERMWEEFTQSIHTFIEDKKNLAQHTQGKKKATLIVIPSVSSTRRPGSPLHLPNEEPVLGYLKFSAKGTKREVFGMPILNDLITWNDIRAKRSKAGKVVKKRTKKSSLLLVDEFVDEGVPERLNLEATTQRPIEESLKEVHDAHRGPHPPVVIREPDSGKFQPLPEVQGKGKEKVSDEQVALDLLTLQTPKKKSPTEQYIFQRHTSTPTESSGHDESSSLYAELGLIVSETESDEEVPGIVARVQDEGQVGPNLGDDAASQPPLSHVVHAGPNLEHMDLEASITSIQPNPEQMDEEFTTTAYPNELSFTNKFLAEKSQEDEPEKTNIEAEVKSMVTVPIHQDTSSVPLMTTPAIDLIVSQPVPTAVQAPIPTLTATATTTTTTTTTLPPTPIPPQPQQGSSDSILIKRIGELEQHMADMVEANQALEKRLDKQASKLYKLENLNIPHQVSKVVDEIVTDAVDWAIQAPLRDRFKDLPKANMKEILHHRMWESNSYQAHEDHKMLYEALEKPMARDHTDQLLTDLVEARRKKEKRRDSPKTPPGSPPHQPLPPPPPAGSSKTPGASGSSQLPPSPPHPYTHQSDQSTSTAAPSSSKTAALVEYTAWMTTDARLKPYVLSILEELHMDYDTTHDEQVQSSSDEDISHDHIPMMNLRQN